MFLISVWYVRYSVDAIRRLPVWSIGFWPIVRSLLEANTSNHFSVTIRAISSPATKSVRTLKLLRSERQVRIQQKEPKEFGNDEGVLHLITWPDSVCCASFRRENAISSPRVTTANAWMLLNPLQSKGLSLCLTQRCYMLHGDNDVRQIEHPRIIGTLGICESLLASIPNTKCVSGMQAKRPGEFWTGSKWGSSSMNLLF